MNIMPHVVNNRLVSKSGSRGERKSPARDYLREHPEAPVEEVIAAFGISRARAFAIRAELDLPRRRRHWKQSQPDASRPLS